MDGEVRSIPETHPVEAGRWDVAANGRGPSGVPHDSKEVVWWTDRSGRRWRDRVCDVCSPWFEDPRRRPHASRNAVPGVNDLATTDPALAAEWDADLNGGLRPEDVTRGNRSCVHWIDGRGHRWIEEVNNRSHGNGCPVCSGRKVARGVNDLATVRPDLAAEWDRERNWPLTPEDVTENSARKVHWICPGGHRGVATVNARSRGLGCPVCAEENRTRRLADAYGSLADTGAPFLSEWASDLNPPGLKPGNLRPNSLVKAFWRCGNGHVWRASVHNRWMGSGCPYCVRYRASFCEKAVAFYVGGIVDVVEGFRSPFLGRSELDIYIPSMRLGIEYDGSLFHTDPSKDMRKDRACADNGVRLIRIREADCPPLTDGCETIRIRGRFTRTYGPLDDAIRELIATLNAARGVAETVDIDTLRDKEAISEKVPGKSLDRTVLACFPLLLDEMSPETEGNGTGYRHWDSKRVVMWRCSRCSHEWESQIRRRARTRFEGCPRCGFNPYKEIFLRENPDYFVVASLDLDGAGDMSCFIRRRMSRSPRRAEMSNRLRSDCAG